jgi:hypothetical protein
MASGPAWERIFLFAACPNLSKTGNSLFTSQIWGREKVKMQSNYRASAIFFLIPGDFFLEWISHGNPTGFLLNSCWVAALLLCRCCLQQKNSNPTATW